MLQWATVGGGWEHRAFWGADLIPWGTPGTPSRLSFGRLPFSDEWVRLDVPAPAVGVAGTTVTGMAFTLFSGRATWDYAGHLQAPGGLLAATVSPRSVFAGTRTVRVHAIDSTTGVAVTGRVLLAGQDVAATDEQFTRQYDESDNPVHFQVRVPGYPVTSAWLTVRAIDDPGP